LVRLYPIFGHRLIVVIYQAQNDSERLENTNSRVTRSQRQKEAGPKQPAEQDRLQSKTPRANGGTSSLSKATLKTRCTEKGTCKRKRVDEDEPVAEPSAKRSKREAPARNSVIIRSKQDSIDRLLKKVVRNGKKERVAELLDEILAMLKSKTV
jgi:hypothetical protein